MSLKLSREEKIKLMSETIALTIREITAPRSIDKIGELVDAIDIAEADPSYDDKDWVIQLIGEVSLIFGEVIAEQMKADLRTLWWPHISQKIDDIFDDDYISDVLESENKKVITSYFSAVGSRFDKILDGVK